MPKRKIILVAILTILIIVGGVSFYVFWPKSKISQIEPQEIEVKPQEYGAGEIGEVPEEKIPLALVIFNTTGVVKEIKENYLIVEGDGTNFADQIPRTLKLIFTESTKTFKPGQKVYYQGLDGLKYLKPEMKILIDGDENIRGKIEFQVRTINILSK